MMCLRIALLILLTILTGEGVYGRETAESKARAESAAAGLPFDLRAAAGMVDSVRSAGNAEAIVGLWEYPGDGVTVAVLPSSAVGRQFTMSVVDSSVPVLFPGRIIAEMEATPEARTYRMKVRDKSFLRLIQGTEWTAIVTPDMEGVRFSIPKISLRINPLALLPNFSRVLRLSINVPQDKATVGLVRRYPTYDDAGGSRRIIREL